MSENTQRRRAPAQALRDAAESNPSTSPGPVDAPHVLRARAYDRMAEAYGLLAQAERANDVRDIYSTKRGHEPPEYRDRHREWARLCPTIAGAYKTSSSTRWWSISRADYERHLASTAAPAAANDAPAEPWTPAMGAQMLGYRRQGGTR